MSHENRFSKNVQSYLDGEPVESLDQRVRAEAARFEAAIARYAASLEAPGEEVDRVVMAAIRERLTPARRRSLWRWFIQPHAVRVRPALAAAAVIAVFGLAWFAVPQRRASMSPAQQVSAAQERARTVLVRFELLDPDAERVTLAGSFSDWDASAISLTRNPVTGLWTVTVPLAPGEHQYLFVVDGERWIPDPSAHAQVDDGFGQMNSVIVVGPRGMVRS